MVSLESDGKAILKVFIGAIITVVIIALIASTIVPLTETSSITNNTVTAPAINATLDLTGRTLILEVLIVNASNSTLTSNGIFLQTGTGTNGLQTVQLTVNQTGSAFAGTSVNVSYTFQPDGYLDNSGARAITLLITIFAALAIVIFVLVVFMRGGSLGKLMGRS